MACERSGTQTQLLKGVLDLAVLAILERGPTYGYDVTRQLREAGLDDVAEPSVYGTLRRLFESGALSSWVVPSEEGPHRKCYESTKSGVDQLELTTKTWTVFTAYVDAVRIYLSDLPEFEVEELMRDIEVDVAEVAAECDGPLTTVLGSPIAFVEAYREAARVPKEALCQRISPLSTRSCARSN